MEAFNLSVANEDHNVYTFDMRKLDIALNVHKDHVRFSLYHASTLKDVPTGLSGPRY